MPLSKKRNRYRMREIRLHAKKKDAVVQPKTPEVPVYVDADGNPVYIDN